jgi:hypothetical protein
MKSGRRTGHGAGSGISAADDRGYNGLEFPRSATATTTKNLGILCEFSVDEANDLQEY